MKTLKYFLPLSLAAALVACGGKQESGTQTDTIALQPAPVFAEDSAMAHIVKQCAFGARVPGSDAHRQCGDWIVSKFKRLGLQVTEQHHSVVAWDGRKLPLRNIIAATKPDAEKRVLLCAHWDSRPWADNDPDASHWSEPVMAANDGASGVAVMLEIARLASACDTLQFGIDFICFDVEDYGHSGDNDSWCLGSTHWSMNKHRADYAARYGILFDMVGGRGARFAQEGYSMHYARPVVARLWQIARQIGYSSVFVPQTGGVATDDHVPVNQIAGIPCIDIIPHHEDGPSSFGPTWHTVNDTPDNIDPSTLKAVGQSVVQMLWNN